MTPAAEADASLPSKPSDGDMNDGNDNEIAEGSSGSPAGVNQDDDDAKVPQNDSDGDHDPIAAETADGQRAGKRNPSLASLFDRLRLSRGRMSASDRDASVTNAFPNMKSLQPAFNQVSKEKARAAAEKAKVVAVEQIKKALNNYVIKNTTMTTTTTTTTMTAADAESAGIDGDFKNDGAVDESATPIKPADTYNKNANNNVISTTTSTTTSTEGWHFRSLFVVEITLLPIIVLTASLLFWMLNRQTHMRPTKGTRVNYKKRSQRRRRRQRNRREKQATAADDDEKEKKLADGSDDDDPYAGDNDDDDDDDDSSTNSTDSSSQINFKNTTGGKASNFIPFDDGEDNNEGGDRDELLNKIITKNSAKVASSSSSLPIDKHRRKNILRQSRRQSYRTMLQFHETDRDSDYEDETVATDTEVAASDFGLSDLEDDFSEDESSFDPQDFSSAKHRKQLYKVMKNTKLFSYLTVDAMKICIQHVETIQLQPNEVLFGHDGHKPSDGSMYAVVSGKVRCRFHSMKLPSDEPTAPEELPEYPGIYGITCEAGEIVTSLITMLAGMVHHERTKNIQELSDFDGNVLSFAQSISAMAIDGPAELIRVPPSCFARICNMFPANVHRIAQTVLLRAQRLTSQCLINTLGMRSELLEKPLEKPQSERTKRKVEDWRKLLMSDSPSATSTILQDACEEFLSQFKITPSSQTLSLLHGAAKIITLTQPDEILIEASRTHDYCYLLLNGNLESGIGIPQYNHGITTATTTTTASNITSRNENPSQSPTNPNRGGSKENVHSMTWEFDHHETLTPGTVLGEYVCFTDDLSLFTVRNSSGSGKNDSVATSAATLLQIPKHVFHTLMIQHPSQVMISSLESILQRVPQAVHLLTWSSDWSYAESAHPIVTEGSPCDSLYVVLNGRLRAIRSKGKKKSHHNSIAQEEFGRGKLVGQVECLTSATWPFDLCAIRNSEVVRVPLRTMLVIINEFPTAGLYFARAIAMRIRQKDAHSGRIDLSDTNPLPSYGLKVATVAVIPLIDRSIEEGTLLDNIVSSFNKNAPCKLLTKRMVKTAVGEKPKTSNTALYDLRLTRFLADMEENNRLVLYQADARFTWWTKICIQQADSILLVVDASKKPSLGRVEQSLIWAYESMGVRIDLLVIEEKKPNCDGDDNYIPEGQKHKKKRKAKTATEDLNTWSEKRKWIAGHHLVRQPYDKHKLDFSRMSRRVCGNSLGLVLGGGGARGLAHLGVYKALLELGVTVDIVGGTSQGAFVGALLARQPDNYNFIHDACHDMATKMSSVSEKFFDLTLPMVSTFSGFMFSRTIRKLLGESTKIQDLVLEFYCVSVDLLKPEQIVHRKGCLWKYVQASMSLSGYLPPVAENGRYLVDGGYMNVIPADVMRTTMQARTVISVDVSPESTRDYYDYGTSLSGWWILWNSMNPFARTVNVPSMMDLNGLLVWASSERYIKECKVYSDLDLLPPVKHIGVLEYDKFDEIVNTSYQYSKPILEKFVKNNPWLIEKDETT